LPAAFCPRPIARHPTPVWRRRAPETAHPDKVAAVILPTPVTGHPLYIFSLGLLVGRHFFDWGGRLFPDERPGARLGSNGFGIGFMNRAARQNFHSFFTRGVVCARLGSLFCARRFLRPNGGGAYRQRSKT